MQSSLRGQAVLAPDGRPLPSDQHSLREHVHPLQAGSWDIRQGELREVWRRIRVSNINYIDSQCGFLNNYGFGTDTRTRAISSILISLIQVRLNLGP